MFEKGGFVAAGILEGVGENGHPLEVFLGQDLPGHLADRAVVPRQPVHFQVYGVEGGDDTGDVVAGAVVLCLLDQVIRTRLGLGKGPAS